MLRTAIVVLILLIPGAVFAQCVSGNVVAESQTTGPFAGLYKYTVTFSWDTTQGLSNVTMECGFGLCPEYICQQIFMFDTPAGTTDGEPAPCTVDYAGEFNCNGNPSIGWTDPVVKWDAIAGACEPGNTGSGVLCFYTNMGPSPESELPLFLVKNGQQVCQGTLTGDCPTACPVPIEQRSLGAVKALYNE